MHSSYPLLVAFVSEQHLVDVFVENRLSQCAPTIGNWRPVLTIYSVLLVLRHVDYQDFDIRRLLRLR